MSAREHVAASLVAVDGKENPTFSIGAEPTAKVVSRWPLSQVTYSQADIVPMLFENPDVIQLLTCISPLRMIFSKCDLQRAGPRS